MAHPSLTLYSDRAATRAVRLEPAAPASAPPVWERVAAGFILSMLTGALIGPILAPDQAETPILRLFWLPVYATTAGLILLRIKTVAKVWPAWLALMAVVLLAFASQFWSIDPATTQRRVIALSLNGAFALYLGARFQDVHLPRLLTYCALVLGVLSLFMVFAVPSIGVHHDVNAGMWRGVWYEKNQMGIAMAAGATAAAAWLAAEDRFKLPPVLGILLCLGLVLATQSKTSLLCALIGVGVIGILSVLKRSPPALIIVAIWIGLVSLAVGWWLWSFESGEILKALGKDPTLTGRTGIWEALFRKIDERPWTGYGYNAFWGRDSEPAAWIRHQTGWSVPSAHNGWIDLLIQLGWPGAVLVGSLISLTYLATLARLPAAGRREGFWGIAYLSVYLLLTLSESVLVSAQGMPWVLCLAILARAVFPEPLPERVTLAPNRRAAYQTGPRIASD